MAGLELSVCGTVRETLQDLHDRGQEPGGEVAAHLASCRRCARFQDLLQNLRADLRAAIEEPLGKDVGGSLSAGMHARLPLGRQPRAEARWREPLGRQPRADAWRVAIPAIAALLVICAATALGITGRASRREREETRASIAFFVDGLFSAPPLANTEYLPAYLERESSPGGARDEYGIGIWLEGE